MIFVKKTLRLCPYALLLTLFACQSTPSSQRVNEPLTIAVAANVQFAMEELEAAFEETTGIPVEIVFGSSGKLTAQITQAAPYDIFVSADIKYPESLYENGRAAHEPKIYAYGALVVWTMKNLDVKQDSLHVLTEESLHKIAIANPTMAPYGEQAVRALQYYKLYEKVQAKLVFGESIAQTNQYILSGACDIGITAKSVVLSPELKTTGTWVEINPAAYEPIAQGVIITRYGQEHHAEAAQQFYDFLFSEQADRIFAAYGYTR